ncbi:CDP-alcohol phosphatidyltransferase family protein [Chloroflexota bacterium]
MPKVSHSIKELREKCQAKGHGRFYIDWTDYLPRVFSIYFTRCFISLRMSANQVTLVSLVVGILVAVLIGLGEPLLMLIAGILLYLFLILDCSDGEVARYYSMQSYTGFYLDRMVTAVIYPAVLFATGINVFQETGFIWDIIIAMIAASSLLLIRISRSYIYSSPLESILYSRVKPMKSALSYKDLPQSSGSKASKVAEPGVLQKFPLLGFMADLVIANGWALIIWIWVTALVSLSSLIFSHPAFLKEILRPLIWLYALCGPLATAYVIWSTVRSRLPDSIALSLVRGNKKGD